MSFWKIIKSKHYSLARQYIYFAITIICLIVGSIFWISYSTFKLYEAEREQFLIEEIKKIQIVFDERMLFVENLLQFTGNKLARNADKSLNSIASVITHHPDTFKDDAFSWHMICFIDNDNNIVINSRDGIVNPIKQSIEKRNWLTVAKDKPWKLMFSKPDIGYITGDYILPGGMAIYDKKSESNVGYLSMGMSIGKLVNSLLQATNDDASFIIVDKQNNVLISSEPGIENSVKLASLKPLYDLDGEFTRKLDNEIEFDDYRYNYSLNSARYPFAILIGYNAPKYLEKLGQVLVPKISSYIILGLVFIVILFLLSMQVLKPILELGKVADNISKGKKFKIKKYKTHELNILAQQLEDISDTTASLQRQKNLLAKANEKLFSANEFIQSNMSFLSHELTNPTASIIGFSKIIKQQIAKSDNTVLQESVDMLNKTAVYQSKQLNFFLRLFQFQEAKKKPDSKELILKELIEWNVSMIRHHAQKKRVRITIKVEDGLKITGDEVMIGQLVQNLATNGAKYNREGGFLIIKAYSDDHGNAVMEFIDNGIGIAKKDLKRIFKKFTRIKANEAIGYGIGLAYAKECIDAHNAELEIKSVLGEGSVFKVVFPLKKRLQKKIIRLVALKKDN